MTQTNLLLMLLLAIFTILFWPTYFKISEKLKKNKLSKLRQYGEVIESIITGIHNDALIMGNDVMVCRIHAKSEIKGVQYNFISGKLYPKDCDHLNEGDSIKVLINPQNPKEYYFEFDPTKMDY